MSAYEHRVPGAAQHAVLRRSPGPSKHRVSRGPGSAAHRFTLRCARDTSRACMTALWTSPTWPPPCARTLRRAAGGVSGISIDSRSLGRGEAFFAIQGDARDGHDFVDNALKAGAGLGRRRPRQARALCRRRAAADRRRRARGLARSRPRRARALHGPDRRRHRHGRQDHDQGDACGSRCPPTARPMPRPPPTTITGACR